MVYIVSIAVKSYFSRAGNATVRRLKRKDYVMDKGIPDEKKKNDEAALFLCNCRDCSSHIELSWHENFCEYKKWWFDERVRGLCNG
jgi:hypothetical protein